MKKDAETPQSKEEQQLRTAKDLFTRVLECKPHDKDAKKILQEIKCRIARFRR